MVLMSWQFSSAHFKNKDFRNYPQHILYFPKKAQEHYNYFACLENLFIIFKEVLKLNNINKIFKQTGIRNCCFPLLPLSEKSLF